MLVFRPLLSTLPTNIYEDKADWGNDQCGRAPFSSSGLRGGEGAERSHKGLGPPHAPTRHPTVLNTQVPLVTPSGVTAVPGHKSVLHMGPPINP